MFTLSVSDPEPPREFALRVPLLQRSSSTTVSGSQADSPNQTDSKVTIQSVKEQRSLSAVSEGLSSSENDNSTTGFLGLTVEEVDEMLEALQQQIPQHQRSVDDVLDEDLKQVLGMDIDNFSV